MTYQNLRSDTHTFNYYEGESQQLSMKPKLRESINKNKDIHERNLNKFSTLLEIYFNSIFQTKNKTV